MARVRALTWYGVIMLILIISYPAMLYAKYLNMRGNYVRRNKYASLIVRQIGKAMFYTTGSRLKITGRENIPADTHCIFVSNHLGHLDGIIVHGFIKKPKGFISINKYENAPILGKWMKLMGSVFVDRENVRHNFTALKDAVDILDSGHSMVIFPEGKLNDGKGTLEFQKGWLRLVRHNNIPIVPVTLKDTYKILSYDGKLMHPTKVECHISKPIYVTELKRSEDEKFLNELKNTILAKL